MSDITKIKVDGEPESSYQLYPRNNEFAKRSGGTGEFVTESDVNRLIDEKLGVIENGTY